MSKNLDMNKLCFGCMTETENEVCPVCGMNRNEYQPEPHQLPPGSELAGRYIIGKVLGEGGFGITYMGWDKTLEIRVAIKEYYPSGLVTREKNEEKTGTVSIYTGEKKENFKKGMDRFLDEIHRLAKFRNYPGIVGVSDYFEENNTVYMVMDYVDGIDMSSYLKQIGGKMPIGKAIQMLTPVMQSLQEVHKEGIIHRDISPDNIMVQENGEVRLIDFGAARDFGNDNKSLSIVLKPGYAPEEQYRSKGNQGPWTDVYALCATMYKMVTGVTPEESMDRMSGETMKTPSELGLTIASNVEQAIMAGMAIRASDRIQSMEELYRVITGEIPLSEAIAFTKPVTTEQDEKTVYVENEVDFENIPDKRESFSVLKRGKRVKKAGAALLAVFAIVLVVGGYVLATRTSDSDEEKQVKATPTPIITLSPEEEKYTKAVTWQEKGMYQEAAGAFQELGNYQDSVDRANECNYQIANQLYKDKNYAEAETILLNVSSEKGQKLYQKCKTKQKNISSYQQALESYKKGEYESALKILKKIKGYKPATKLKKKVKKQIANMPPDTPVIGEFFDTTPNVEGDGVEYTVKWDPVSGADGYQYSYKETMAFEGGDEEPYYDIGETQSCSYSVGASDSIKVEFSVRAYKYINGKKQYGNWSRTVYCYLN